MMIPRNAKPPQLAIAEAAMSPYLCSRNAKEGRVSVKPKQIPLRVFPRKDTNMEKNTLLLLFLFIGPADGLTAQNDTAQASLDLEATYTGDAVADISGGVRRGGRYMGYATLGIHADMARICGLRGGTFYMKGGNTHGGEPSAQLIGDVQKVSNIEAGDHTFLAEMWYSQQMGPLTATLGLQDLNTSYASCDAAASFLNGSFGIPSIFSCTYNAPIFPLTGLGLNLCLTLSPLLTLQAAAYDGSPLGFGSNPYNIRWKLSRSRGFLLMTEASCTNAVQTTTLKAGTHYLTSEHCFGVYGIVQQTLWRRADAFLQVDYTPKEQDNNYLYLGTGINLHPVIGRRGNDAAGMAVASAFFCNDERNETTLEAFYRYELPCHLFFQPDLQYVINPLTIRGAKNALVALLRFGFKL